MNLKLKYLLAVVTLLGVVVTSTFFLFAALKGSRYEEYMKSCLRTEGTDLTYCKESARKIFK